MADDPITRSSRKANGDCTCFAIGIFLASIAAGSVLLFGLGDCTFHILDLTILGSWLALPGACLTGLAILVLAPWMLNMKV